MAVKGIGFIDELHWEGADTCGVHMIYTVFVAENPHGEEVYGGLDITGLSPGLTAAAFNADLGAALRAHLENEHDVTFQIGDTVRIMGGGVL